MSESKKCPECDIELTEIYTEFGNKLQCEMCGYIEGETSEERYVRVKEEFLKRNKLW